MQCVVTTGPEPVVCSALEQSVTTGFRVMGRRRSQVEPFRASCALKVNRQAVVGSVSWEGCRCVAVAGGRSIQEGRRVGQGGGEARGAGGFKSRTGGQRPVTGEHVRVLVHASGPTNRRPERRCRWQHVHVNPAVNPSDIRKRIVR